ncbi:hypothetical protein DFH08DRAFT_156932 [Mycena albidolilacea]|uniref:Uncharacterized protein n=1 Tax=Mycena albidolilacea TaxID=1033008 RepID=A0AAD7A259_9AGAR|nr:hypothetical protein DFH08DRAFT_156932 [Mycena albidolilacea]
MHSSSMERTRMQSPYSAEKTSRRSIYHLSSESFLGLVFPSLDYDLAPCCDAGTLSVFTCLCYRHGTGEEGRPHRMAGAICGRTFRVLRHGPIDSHKALVSHPRHLPQEVIENIFLACLPTSRHTNRHDKPFGGIAALGPHLQRVTIQSRCVLHCGPFVHQRSASSSSMERDPQSTIWTSRFGAVPYLSDDTFPCSPQSSSTAICFQSHSPWRSALLATAKSISPPAKVKVTCCGV